MLNKRPAPLQYWGRRKKIHYTIFNEKVLGYSIFGFHDKAKYHTPLLQKYAENPVCPTSLVAAGLSMPAALSHLL